MSKFHSTVSRRDFMKGLGLAGAGLGAAVAAAPVFHDMDEVTSSKTAGRNLPWYVEELDFGTMPGLEVDWSMVERHPNYYIEPRYTNRGVSGSPRRMDGSARPAMEAWLKALHPEYEGATLRDHAMHSAANLLKSTQSQPPFTGSRTMVSDSWHSTYRTPESLGLPKWQGTPEENTKMIRSAFAFFGAWEVNICEMDEETKKLLYSREYTRHHVVFEDVDAPYMTSEKEVIPNKLKYLIQIPWIQTPESALREGSIVGYMSIEQSAPYSWITQTQCLEFLYALGYNTVSGCDAKLGFAFPLALRTGFGQASRYGTIAMSPKYGSLVRKMSRIITDLPLEPTKPIDFGSSRFCETCGICANNCPFNAISGGEKTWEAIAGLDEHVIEGNPPVGWKGWKLDGNLCNNCGACIGFCPFNTTRESWAHHLVIGTQSVTPIFNGFFSNMTETFGYGHKNPETWWDLDHEPVGGYPAFYINR